MPKTQSDLSKLGDKLSPPALPFSEGDVSAFRLRPADVARLLGVTRARVSQLTRSGRITRFPDGSIDPNRAAAELIRCDPVGARSKILVGIREAELDAQARMFDALVQRDAMASERDRLAAERDNLAAELADVREVLRAVARAWLSSEYWLNALDTITRARAASAPQTAEDLDAAFDQAGDAALGASLAELSARADPDLIASIAYVDPDGPIARAWIPPEPYAEPPPAADCAPEPDPMDRGIALSDEDFERECARALSESITAWSGSDV